MTISQTNIPEEIYETFRQDQENEDLARIRGELLAILSGIVNHLAKVHGKENPIVISSNGEIEFEIVFPKKS